MGVYDLPLIVDLAQKKSRDECRYHRVFARFENDFRAANPRAKNQVVSKKMKVLLRGGEFEGTYGLEEIGINGLESLVINDGAVGVDRYEIGRIGIRL